MTWIYDEKIVKEVPEGYVGFVYIITHKATGKYYIGKKSFYFKKTRQVKGKKKRYLAESDWQDYYGSSETIIEDVAVQGVDAFERKILRYCKSKAELSYYEAKYQFERNAILDPNSYNSWISVRVRRAHLGKLIEELKNGAR